MSFDHFIEAQNLYYTRAHRELTRGHKVSCWMWYMFPQLYREESSMMAKKYALDDLSHAIEYMSVDVLYARYVALVDIVFKHIQSNRTAAEIFGEDNMKLVASLSLMRWVIRDDVILDEIEFILNRAIGEDPRVAVAVVVTLSSN